MRRSQDLRKRVIVFVRRGGSTTEPARRFQVSRASGYNWTSVPTGLVYRRPGPRGPRRLDWEALRSDVATYPDRTQKERARPHPRRRNAGSRLYPSRSVRTVKIEPCHGQ
jgi:transposase